MSDPNVQPLPVGVTGRAVDHEPLKNGAEISIQPGELNTIGTKDFNQIKLEPESGAENMHAALGVIEEPDGHQSIFLSQNDSAVGNTQLILGNKVVNIGDGQWYQIPLYSSVIIGGAIFLVAPAKSGSEVVRPLYKLIRQDTNSPSEVAQFTRLKSLYDQFNSRKWVEGELHEILPGGGISQESAASFNSQGIINSIRQMLLTEVAAGNALPVEGKITAGSLAAALSSRLNQEHFSTGRIQLVAEMLLKNGYAVGSINEYTEETIPSIRRFSVDDILKAIVDPIPRRATKREVQIIQGFSRPKHTISEPIDKAPMSSDIEALPLNGEIEILSELPLTKTAELVGGYTEAYSLRHENQDRAFVEFYADRSMRIGLLDVSGGALSSEGVAITGEFTTDRLLRRFGNKFVGIMRNALRIGTPYEALFRPHSEISMLKRDLVGFAQPDDFPGYGVANALIVSAPDSAQLRKVDYAHAGDSPIVKFSPNRKFDRKRIYEEDQLNSPKGHFLQLITVPDNVAEAFHQMLDIRPLHLKTIDYEASSAANQINPNAILGGRQAQPSLDIETGNFVLDADEMLIIGSDGIRINDWLAEKSDGSGDYEKPYAQDIHNVLMRACLDPLSANYLSPNGAAEEIKKILRNNGEHDDITIIIVPPIRKQK